MEPLTELATLTLPGCDRSAKYARNFVREMLGRDHPAFDDAELCVSELVTNAAAHTRSGKGGKITVTLSTGDGVVQLTVRDDGADDKTPSVRDGPLDETGRGLLIVQNLSDEWGVREDDDGTTIWARLRR